MRGDRQHKAVNEALARRGRFVRQPASKIDGFIVHVLVEEVRDGGGKGTTVWSNSHSEPTPTAVAETLAEMLKGILPATEYPEADYFRRQDA